MRSVADRPGLGGDGELHSPLALRSGYQVENLENFTTEALGAAVRSDWRPFVTLMHEQGLLEPDLVPDDVQVVTQRPVAGGAVDFVATLIGPDWTREIWLEVKVDSGIHGDQIATYQAAIAATGELPTVLALLVKRPITGHGELPQLTWRQVRESAKAAPSSAILWHDLALYLEDVHVTDPFDEPVAEAEASAMLDAATLLRKMRRLLRDTALEAQERWSELEFPKAQGVANRFVEEQFADHARLAIGTRSHRAQVYFGMVQREATIDWIEREPHVAVWVEHHPKATDVRRRLIAAAASGQIDSQWQRSWKGYWALVRHAPAKELEDLPAMREWWFARLDELDRAGIVNLIPQLGIPTAEEDLAKEDDDVDSPE